MCQSSVFTGFIIGAISVNTICLALDKYPTDPQESQVLDILNIIFFVIFFIEMIIKLIALGIKKYLRDSYNIFDALIILLSIADLILTFTL